MFDVDFSFVPFVSLWFKTISANHEAVLGRSAFPELDPEIEWMCLADR
jgi:hypothetical protein